MPLNVILFCNFWKCWVSLQAWNGQKSDNSMTLKIAVYWENDGKIFYIFFSMWSLETARVCCRYHFASCAYIQNPACKRLLWLLHWHGATQWPLTGTAEWRTRAKFAITMETASPVAVLCCAGTSVRDSSCSEEFLPMKLFLRLVSGWG